MTIEFTSTIQCLGYGQELQTSIDLSHVDSICIMSHNLLNTLWFGSRSSVAKSPSMESIALPTVEDQCTQTEYVSWTGQEETIMKQDNIRDIRIKQLTESVQDLLGKV
jgi:uncharacterized protein YbcI